MSPISSVTVVERAVIYARTSGDDTRNDGRNLAGQLEMGREYALNKGYNIVAELHEDDRGASGALIDLPQLNHIRDMARRREFEVLVVREVDRLSRNLAKQLIVEEELNRSGVRVEYVLAEYDDSPEGRLNKHIRATIAEYEREKIRERLVRGRRLSVKNGNINVSDRPPYGYKVVKEDGQNRLEIIEEEARIVRLIFEWYVYGDESGNPLSTEKIVKKLTKLGVPTRGDKYKHVKKKRGYGQWNRQTVRRILTRETYIGTWHFGKLNPDENDIPIEVPPIVTPELFAAVMPRLERNRKMSSRNTKHEYLMAKQLTCGCCGYKMTGIKRKHKNKDYCYYRCPAKYHVDSTRSCALPQFRQEKVDDAVWNWIKSVLSNPKMLSQGLEDFQEQQERENAPLRQRLSVINDLLIENKDKLDRLLELYISGELAKEMLVDHKHRLEKTQTELEAEKTRLVQHLETKELSAEQLQTLEQFAHEIGEGLSELDDNFGDRRKIIDMLDVQAILAVEDDQKIVRVQCRLGNKSLSIEGLVYYEKFW